MSVWSLSVLISLVVNGAVMMPAQRDRVGEVGLSAVLPWVSVVEFAPGDGSFAAVCGAGLMCSRDRDSVGLGEKPLGSSEVEWDGFAAEDHGDDPCVAGEPACFSG